MRVLMLLSLTLLLAGCSDDGSPADSGVDQKAGDSGSIDLRAQDSSPGPDLPAPDYGSPQLTLTENHSGWKKALCFNCHDSSASYPHGSKSYKEPDCAECHGYNGAPHTAHATTGNSGCMNTNCHATTVHAQSFNSPADCVVCHFHPGS